MFYEHLSKNIIIEGDLLSRSFEDLLDNFGLANHVNLPTHTLVLDPIITDLPVTLETVSSTDHCAIPIRLNIRAMREEAFTRSVWHWGRSNWQSLRDALNEREWNSIQVGDVDDQAQALTRHLVTL